ncbi:MULTISPECIES: PaaI family thioesterase [Chryseobacterium]|uniref:Acyl-coenzyme A thioesterase 13 n=1 Tax=Chryseobacterium camelliae TaxID=1265445 RepID=A0ABU0TN25_9FLAO|nr:MULTISPECIES: PaaI family thioesterase [Chryseobacterium]MDT3407708.1 acyl-coenzyme A thioesterase 13 [Pseudacidovorax intermedius]MDQ1098440.1 acyl-coenzyme A thioesterase 13 [Chryseobacterium camelliae]MDQ1102364.1 acyl-coenzyme A thioesterase 13 [Chryseobacterium sp. SORGH_AS_1048]MDR6085801.1 acyl-coenzyme A thioesterase 13 [Chryseobacterium sp. SORGH_AS_0909]MDR6130164.1 acyl-coenzyme A thioesterase 13 [Chryseobacterium sp. SORGH_AS_1175]
MDKLEILRSFTGKEFSASPSPFMRWLNPVVLSAEEGEIAFQYTVREEWLNPMGNLHGGVTAAIIDDIIGATMFSLNEKNFIVTVNNSIDYFSTAKENDHIIAETKIIKRGKQFVNAQCEIWNADRTRLIARGTSNLFKIND